MSSAILETVAEGDVVSLMDEGSAVTLSNTFDVNQLAPADDDDANSDLFVSVSGCTHTRFFFFFFFFNFFCVLQILKKWELESLRTPPTL